MSSSSADGSDVVTFQRIVDVCIRLGILFVLISWCFDIVRPFMMPVLWGAILAVALFHPFKKLEGFLGGRRKLAATVFGLVGVALLVVPSYIFFGSVVQGSTSALEQLSSGTFKLEPPPESIKDWPWIGESIYTEWLAASVDLPGTLETFGPQIKGFLSGAVGFIAGLGKDILLFVVSTLIAAVFLATSDTGSRSFQAIFRRFVGERGDEYAQLTTATIRNVAKGVVGVAVIQAFLCGIGLMVAGIPGTGLWTVLILILAVIQLPPLLILAPLIAYQFYQVETLPAVLFMIWSLIAGGSDSFLKPIFLGRGMKTPMLVILLGALGGMIWAGMIGLFLGAVVLSIGYELFIVWLNVNDEKAGVEAAAE